MKAMIFAAGLGTRLKPLTDSIPKALVPVHGEPLIHHVIYKLQSAGFSDLVINIHHFGDQIRRYLEEKDCFGARISFSEEQPALLETGGGILHAKDLLLAGTVEDEPFLVHNVDILSDIDLQWFASCWRSDALALLLVSRRDTRRYLLFDDDMRLVGWTDISTGEVRSPFAGLDASKCRRYAFSGIHLMSGHVFSVMEDEGMPERFPIMDFYLKAAAGHRIYGVVPEQLHMVDVGKADTLEALERQSLTLSQLP